MDTDYLPHTVYGKSKMIAEQATRRAKLKCAWTIVRPANVWGPWHMRYPDELLKIIAKGIYVHPGKVPIIRTYGYVKNVVHQIAAILQAQEAKTNGKTYYLGDLPIDSYLWLDALSQTIRGKKIKRVPSFLFLFPALIGDLLLETGIKFPLNSVRYHNMIEDYYAPTNITVREFGLSHPNLKNNAAETVQWLKSDFSKKSKFWKSWFLKKKHSI